MRRNLLDMPNKDENKARARYDDKQLREKLMEIRDRSVDWWLDVTKKKGKTGAASFNFEKAMNELSRLDAVSSQFQTAGIVTIQWGADNKEE